ncbi:putative holin-like toxin [Paenibacillus timonensis]|uniref:Holin-like toxin n=1 Tax=Paenibacillus timonensis TaxID=225915 RepID=A0ABW3S6M4_9BACL
MFLFGSFILALLIYINNNNKRKQKPTPRLTAEGGFSIVND